MRKFKLDEGENRMIDTMIRSISNQWVTILQQRNNHIVLGSWVGCFKDNSQYVHLMAVFQSFEFFRHPRPRNNTFISQWILGAWAWETLRKVMLALVSSTPWKQKGTKRAIDTTWLVTWDLWQENDHLAYTTRQMTWQNLLEYARIALDNLRKNVDRVAIYDDVIGN